MWEVRIGFTLHETYRNHGDALDEADKLREQGNENVRVIGVGDLAERAQVQIDALPYALRDKAA